MNNKFRWSPFWIFMDHFIFSKLNFIRGGRFRRESFVCKGQSWIKNVHSKIAIPSCQKGYLSYHSRFSFFSICPFLFSSFFIYFLLCFLFLYLFIFFSFFVLSFFFFLFSSVFQIFLFLHSPIPFFYFLSFSFYCREWYKWKKRKVRSSRNHVIKADLTVE